MGRDHPDRPSALGEERDRRHGSAMGIEHHFESRHAGEDRGSRRVGHPHRPAVRSGTDALAKVVTGEAMSGGSFYSVAM